MWHINQHVLPVFYNLFVVFRFGRLLSPAVQHHALPVLQSWRPLLLCQQKWQVLLVVNDGSSSDDACRRRRHQTVHQPLLSVRSSISCHCDPQPGHRNPTVSCGLAQPVDRLLLSHGGFWSGLNEKITSHKFKGAMYNISGIIFISFAIVSWDSVKVLVLMSALILAQFCLSIFFPSNFINLQC